MKIWHQNKQMNVTYDYIGDCSLPKKKPIYLAIGWPFSLANYYECFSSSNIRPDALWAKMIKIVQ